MITYVTHTYRVAKKTPLIHCEHLKGWGKYLQFAWGAEGLQVKLSDDPKATKDIFANHGLKMLPQHATFQAGGVGVEQGVTLIYEAMQAGKFKVFSHLEDWFEEKNLYHRRARDDGKPATIWKQKDDLMDATRYAFMMLRHASKVGLRYNQPQKRTTQYDPRDL